MAGPTHASLLALPPELRHHILSLVTSGGSPSLTFRPPNEVRLSGLTQHATALLSSCRVLRADSLHVLGGEENVLRICTDLSYCGPRSWQRGSVRHVKEGSEGLLVARGYREAVRVVELMEGIGVPGGLRELRSGLEAVGDVFPGVKVVRLKLRVDWPLVEWEQLEELTLREVEGVVASERCRGVVERVYAVVKELVLGVGVKGYRLDIQMQMGHFHATEYPDREEPEVGERYGPCAAIEARAVETEPGAADISIAVHEEFYRWLAFKAEKITGQHEVLFERCYPEPTEEQWQSGRDKIWVKNPDDGKWSLELAPWDGGR